MMTIIIFLLIFIIFLLLGLISGESQDEYNPYVIYEAPKPKPKKTIEEILGDLLLKIIIMLIWVGFYGGLIAFCLFFFFFNKLLISFICLIPTVIVVGGGMIINDYSG